MLLSVGATEYTTTIDIKPSSCILSDLKLGQSLLPRGTMELHALNVQIFLKMHGTNYAKEQQKIVQ